MQKVIEKNEKDHHRHKKNVSFASATTLEHRNSVLPAVIMGVCRHQTPPPKKKGFSHLCSVLLVSSFPSFACACVSVSVCVRACVCVRARVCRSAWLWTAAHTRTHAHPLPLCKSNCTLFWMFLARFAYLRVLSVSMRSLSAGEMHAIIKVLLLPPSESCSSRVS